jgi:hypothetical protein
MMQKSVLRAAMCAALFGACMGSAMAQTLSPAVATPLSKAKSLMAAHKYDLAMAQVNVASTRATNESERFVVEEMRGSVAQAKGDTVTAAKVFADMLNSGKVSAAEQSRLLQAEIGIAFEQKNYPAAIGWLQKYFKAGGASPEMRTQLISAYYLNKDFPTAAKLQQAQIAATVKSGQRPTENQLQLLASCQDQMHDTVGFENTMVQLVTYYPKPDYWANLVHNVQVSPNFSDRLTLDLDRIKLALGTITSPEDYMEMTELALQGPLPGEAKAVIDQGYAKGVLGTGPGAPRQQRLRDLVNKKYAEELTDLPKREPEAQGNHDGNALVGLGEEYVSYGQFDKGISLIEAGQAKDELRHPEDTKLHLALAYLKAGKKPQAVKILKTVGGKDGTAGLARLWVLVIAKT